MADELKFFLAQDLDPVFWPPSRSGVISAWYGHVPFAHWLVTKIKPRVVVELGTHNGVSFAAFCEPVSRLRLPATCYAVDTWQGDEHSGLYGEEVYQDLVRFNSRYSAFAELVRSTFDDALPYLPDSSIDLLHIDGLHTYEAGKHDFETWLPKLSDRAVVLFHDINVRERQFGIWKVIHELKQRYPVFEFFHGSGLGVVCVGPNIPKAVADLCAMDADTAAAIRDRFAAIGAQWSAHGKAVEMQIHVKNLSKYITHSESLQSEVSRLSHLLQEEQSQKAAYMAESTAYRAESNIFQTELKRLEAELNRAGADIDGLNTVVTQLKDKVSHLQASESTLNGRLSEALTNLDEERANSFRLTAQLELLKSNLGFRIGRLFDIGNLGDAYYVWKEYKKGLKSEKEALALINDICGVRGFFALYPFYKVLRPLQNIGRSLKGKGKTDKKAKKNRRVPIDFDPEWYLKAYPDVAEAGIDPLQHYLETGEAEGRYPCPPKIDFDAEWYTKCYPEVKELGLDPLAHYVCFGRAEGRHGTPPPNIKFDPDFYTRLYPDIRESGLDPLVHYVLYGRPEGRFGCSLDIEIETHRDFDPSKKTILIFSHDASQTGAPILAFNLLEKFAARYNVISVMFGPGNLEEAFEKTSFATIGPFPVLFRNSALVHGPILEACRKYSPAFAVVNSIESREALFPLFEEGVPSIQLIHEFATLCMGLDMKAVATLARQIVFPARRVWEDAVKVFPWLAERPANILAQGPSRIPSEWLEGEVTDEEERIASVLRPDGKDDDAVVVIGCGFWDIRKGVDLFVAVADKLKRNHPGKRYRFVWVGNDGKGIYPRYVAAQVTCSGIEDCVDYLDEVNSLKPVYAMADIFLLSSRLDPFPNVAIDAMLAGLPVVCFENASGVAERLENQDGLKELVVPYADTDSAANVIAKLAEDELFCRGVKENIADFAKARFDMDRYVVELEQLAEKATLLKKQEEADYETIRESGLFVPEFAIPADYHEPKETYLKYFVRECVGYGGRRCPFPGFHPVMYRKAHPSLSEEPFENPLAHYIRNGQPKGPWLLDIINPEHNAIAPGNSQSGAAALHLHIHYPDLAAEIFEALASNQARPDIFVSVSSEDGQHEVAQAAEEHSVAIRDIVVVPNRGRDIGPFLTAFGSRLLDYEFIGHLHAKKSSWLSDSKIGEVWFKFCLENLLGGKYHMMDLIFSRLAQDQKLGFVFPCDPNPVGWNLNRSNAARLLARMGIEAELPEEWFFPVGTMFWARVGAIAPFLKLNLDWKDYPREPLASDGTILHAIERLLPIVAQHQGFAVSGTYVPGVTR